MKVFLTGATGYIGSVIGEALLAAGHTVVGLARTVEAEQDVRDRGFTPKRADLKTPDSLNEALDSCEGVIHAGTTNDGRKDTDAVQHMLDRLKSSGKPFVYTSGLWVIGDTGGSVADETAPLNPPALVAWRAGVEKLVLSAASRNIVGIVIRPAMVYGRGLGIPSMFIQSAQETGAARYVGSAENRWSTVHVEDLAELYVLALTKAPAGSLYIGADGPAYRVKEIAEAASFGADAGGRTQSWPLDEARQKLGPFADALVLDQQASGKKAQRELGWKPRGAPILEELRYGSYALPHVSP